MGNSYYVRIRGRINGPFEESKIARLIQQGKLGKSHEVSTDGHTWKDGGSLLHLFESLKPPTTTKSIKPIESEDEIQVDDSTVEPAPAIWFYAIGSERKGPINWPELQSKAGSGEINTNTLVWKEGMDKWLPAADISNLFKVPRNVTDSSSTQLGNKNNKSQISWGELLPALNVINDGSWSLAWVQCLAIALLFPLFVMEYQGIETLELSWVALTFSLYFSLLWTAFFYWCINPNRISPWRMTGVWLFTATLGIFCAIIVSMIIMPFMGDLITNPSEASFLKKIVGWSFGVGITEESAKLLALLFVASQLKAEKLPRTYCFLGVISGLAFGTIEAVSYTHGYVANHENSADPSSQAYGVFLFLLILRWLCLPLLHAVWAGISGYFLGLSYYARQNSWGWVFRGLMISAILHGIYDLGVGDKNYSWLAIASAAVSLALLVGYLRSESTLIERVSAYKPKAITIN